MEADRFVNEQMSILLDGLRGVAALVVLVGHAGQLGLLGPWWPFNALFQHSAVIIFFVMSGLLVHESASRPGTTFYSFAVARASRVLPVTVLALVLTAVLSSLIAPASSGELQRVASSSAPLTSLLFLNERWGGAEPVLNPPYWSLCYEVWFYVLFGVTRFARGPVRVAGLIAAATTADVLILLLLPCWLFGVWVGARGTKMKVSSPHALLASALLAFAVVSWSEFPYQVNDSLSSVGVNTANLRFSSYFITDVIAAAFVAIMLVAARSLSLHLERFLWIARRSAQITFTLYLTHWPLLVAAEKLLPPTSQWLRASIGLVAPIAFAAIVAPLIERRAAQALRALAQTKRGQRGLADRKVLGRDLDGHEARPASG